MTLRDALEAAAAPPTEEEIEQARASFLAAYTRCWDVLSALIAQHSGALTDETLMPDGTGLRIRDFGQMMLVLQHKLEQDRQSLETFETTATCIGCRAIMPREEIVAHVIACATHPLQRIAQERERFHAALTQIADGDVETRYAIDDLARAQYHIDGVRQFAMDALTGKGPGDDLDLALESAAPEPDPHAPDPDTIADAHYVDDADPNEGEPR